MRTPEEKARARIDELLGKAGWVIQGFEHMNLGAGLGVAVREYELPAGPCDYLLFIDGKAAGVVEAKPEGQTLTGVAEQSEKYMHALPPHLPAFGPTLLFDYESTGTETLFRDIRDPDARSRHAFAFHRPETLLEWASAPDTFRRRLQSLPPLDPAGLRQCQIEAIAGNDELLGLERSLARGDPRALVQMATGAGKTHLACTFIYRLVKYAGARRILFLVDRNNLGDQALREFQHYIPPDDPRRFTALYVVQHLKSNTIDQDAKVVITTIQRLYAMLRGEELAPEAEERSAFESGLDGPPQEVTYTPRVPIETFDVIVTDECHRSIYGQWRQVLDYFDAFVIGLTATPSLHTLGFFNRNLVAEYPYERSVIDGVNVSFEIFRVRTRITERGGRVEPGYEVPVMDKKTRRRRYEELDAALDYTAQQLDRSVTVPNQIRAVLGIYRDHLFTDLFPGRREVPKTLIFAKDDAHAETITEIAREVFGRGNAFCKKITYQTSEDPKALLKAFRNEPQPRIVVTVDMIATGTDVKPIEVLVFLRDVKSEIYFEQMKGRGVRSIARDDLLQVTPDAAQGKERFVVVDAVGVTESAKTTMRPLERQRHVSFEKLLEHVASGDRRDETLATLAGRFARPDVKTDEADRARIVELTGGRDLHALGAALLEATDLDRIEQAVTRAHGPGASEEQRRAVDQQIKDRAASPFNDPALRQLLKEARQRAFMVIDEISIDEVVGAGYDVEKARETTRRFEDFIEQNKDRMTALQILYGRPAAGDRPGYAHLQELAHTLTSPPWVLDTPRVWEAYRRLDAAKVRGAPMDKVLTELVMLVRYATGQTEVLESFAVGVEQRFNLWVGRQKKAGREFTDEQMRWLRRIMRFVAHNAEITPRDLLEAPTFTQEGGLVKARQLFGKDRLAPMLNDLTETLAA
jgi:type I restriction enzyme, R subunit